MSWYRDFFDALENIHSNNRFLASFYLELDLVSKFLDDEKGLSNEIRHPLSKGGILVSDIDFEKMLERIKNLYPNISNSQSEEFRALEIWRNLLDVAFESFDDNERKYVAILPVSKVVPKYFLLEHIKMLTAIGNPSKQREKSLFIFSIGPVQSFITQARKTQDLYLGSFMLSYFTFLAARQIIENYGPTSLIYPDLYGQPLVDWYLKNKGVNIKNSNNEDILLPTITNRFVAVLNTTNETEISGLVKNIEQSIKNEIEKAKNIIFKELKIDANINQIVDFPQIYWASIPWIRDDQDILENVSSFFSSEKLQTLLKPIEDIYKKNPASLYHIFYTALEKSIGARKNLRDFIQIEEEGRKCSICGERNVVFFKETKNKQRFTPYNKDAVDLTDKNVEKYISDGEGLCVLCFLKRAFDIYLKKFVSDVFEGLSFPSTAEVASADFKEKAIRYANEEFKEFVNKFISDTKKYHLKTKPLPKISDIVEPNLEGFWFYEENLNEITFKKENIDTSPENIKYIRLLYDRIKDKAGKPKPYYAVFHLDGDKMGDWLAGEHLQGIKYSCNSKFWERLPEDFRKDLEKAFKKGVLTPIVHSSISTALRNYTLEFVRNIVEKEHLGKLVYAGADDVFAFVNLSDIFDVMEKLRWAFSGHIYVKSGKTFVDLENKSGFILKDGVYYLSMGDEASCSMGVVIAHYKEPLKIVLDKVFEMEKLAKKSGRNRFSIALLKKSGESEIAISPWLTDNHLITRTLKALKDDMNSDNERYISDSFIQKFNEEFFLMKKESLEQGIVETELERLIRRAYNSKVKEEKQQKEEFINKFLKNINVILDENLGNIDNFINLLKIASFTNRGY
ncbi:MAG: type III-B CRISPR-associated protein Cas10/Cmr2 [Hydrogenobaculum sp.]|nr:MAG: type III-B CRISPR-associated protein Cas10/Cmr2 [Hydrogenobaculum sp.]